MTLEELTMKPVAPDVHTLDSLARLKETKNLEETAKNFEAVFLSMMVKEMRKSVPGLFGKGPGSNIYESMFDQMMGQSLAEGQGLGLAPQLLQTLKADRPMSGAVNAKPKP